MIRVLAQVPCTAEQAWNFFTDEAHICKWNFASDEWACPSAINELKKGGKIDWRMEAKDGSMGFNLTGIYKTVDVNRHLAYEFTDGRKVFLTLEEMPNSTILTWEFEPENMNPIEMQEAGWQAILNNYVKYVTEQVNTQ